MVYSDITYKSFFWSLGTTSFRTRNFNLHIEAQLDLLEQFWQLPEHGGAEWQGNNKLQEAYYCFMQQHGFVSGDAPQKAKDARQKTSGLADIGLVDEGRKLTPAGRALLQISQRGNYTTNNLLRIPQDSFLYLKQLLKTTNYIDQDSVRPFLVLLYLLSKVEYLTMEEFTYLLPLCINQTITNAMPTQIAAIRQGKTTVDRVLVDLICTMPNYQAAMALFLQVPITEEVIRIVGMNRKSKKPDGKNYDKCYYPFYQALKAACLNHDANSIPLVYETSRALKGTAGTLWRKLLFDVTSAKAIAKAPLQHFKQNRLTTVGSEEEFRRIFFQTLHLYKTKATLADYFDLNKRYIKTTDIVLFEDGKVTLDVIPKHFFTPVIQELYQQAFSPCPMIHQNCSLTEIASCLAVEEQTIINGLNREFGLTITTAEEVYQYVKDQRYRRFHQLIDRRFPQTVLLRLLDLFENRKKDQEINLLVTDNADIPTIFEYILGIIWYQASGRQGDVLHYMKLSLDADLLPRTHAAGGEADIVYDYNKEEAYPAHTLLLEATLTNAQNQRKAEMEPVSRHLGRYLLHTGNTNAYCLFVTNHLDINVTADFRSRKKTPYFDTSNTANMINGMKIIPLETAELKQIVKKEWQYKELYPIFEEAFQSTEPIPTWYHTCVAQRLADNNASKSF